VDDLRATNPPTNGPLLDALAADFRAHGHDLKHLIRTIMASHVYGLASRPNERNVADTRNYSRHYRQRLRAQVLLDALSHLHRGPGAVPAPAARAGGRRPVAAPRRVVVPRHLRPPRPEPGPPVRAGAGHDRRAGPPPDERPDLARQGHRRHRPRGPPGRLRQ